MQNDIEAIRADLAAWSAGKPKAVQNAAANLDGWLDVYREVVVIQCGAGMIFGATEVDLLACTARAVETLRRATGRA